MKLSQTAQYLLEKASEAYRLHDRKIEERQDACDHDEWDKERELAEEENIAFGKMDAYIEMLAKELNKKWSDAFEMVSRYVRWDGMEWKVSQWTLDTDRGHNGDTVGVIYLTFLDGTTDDYAIWNSDDGEYYFCVESSEDDGYDDYLLSDFTYYRAEG